MTGAPTVEAWNNFVMNSRPASYTEGSGKRSAAIANLYMGLTNNGGINSFLTCSYDIDASEVLQSLIAVGALKAANDFERVLRQLGTPVPVSSQNERFWLLDQFWPDEELDDFDSLTAEANEELMRVLERHVAEHEEFYLGLTPME